MGERRPVCLLDCDNQADCEGSSIPGDVICTVRRDAAGVQQPDKNCAPTTNVQQCAWPAPPNPAEE